MMKALKKSVAIIMFLILTLNINAVNVLAQENETNVTKIITSSSLQGNGFRIISEDTSNDAYTAKIAAPNTKVSVGYVNVSLVGDGSGTMYANLWRVGTINNPNIKVTLKRMYTGGDWTDVSTKTFTSIGTLVSPSKISESTSKTAFWKVTLSGSMNGGSITYSTYSFLYNKKAIRYPDYTDSGSGKTLTVPNTNLSVVPLAKRVKWTTTERNKYKKWYDSTYPNKISDWTKYQVHHIIPREYGGTNSNSNLIPLITSYHQKTVSPWWTNYK